MDLYFRVWMETSFVDTVGVSVYGDSYAVLIINGKQYVYSGVDGYAIDNKISQFKRMKNKYKAGSLCSAFIQTLEPYLQKD